MKPETKAFVEACENLLGGQVWHGTEETRKALAGALRIIREQDAEIERLGVNLARFVGSCSRCANESDDLNPLVVDGPDNSRVCLGCFGDTVGEFAFAAALESIDET